MPPSSVTLRPLAGDDGGDHAVVLFMLPWGGGNAKSYDAWAELMPKHVRAYVLELPGRGARAADAPMREMEGLVAAAAAAMKPHLDEPFAIFGHSVGSVMAWAIARHVERIHGRTPLVAVCSGHTSPSRPTTDMHAWSDARLADELRGWGNVDEESLQDPDVLSFLLRTLRADFAITETFCGTERQAALGRLACPLVVCGGTRDPLVPPGDLEAWRGVGDARARVYEGDHFYLVDDATAPAFVADLVADLDAALDARVEQAGAMYRAARRANAAPWPADSLVHTLCLYQDGAPFDDLPAITGFGRTGDGGEARTVLAYRELRAHAASVAQFLRDAHGAGPGRVVALLLERGVDFGVALFAILSSGSAYLELFGTSPKALLAEQLGAASAIAVLTNAANAPKLPGVDGCPIVHLDAALRASAAPDVPRLRAEVWDAMSGDSLCFVVLSSGSTGKPKMMMNPHRMSTHSYYFRNHRFPLGPSDVCGIYVFAIWEIFRPLLAGAHALCIPDSVLYDMESLCTFVGDAGITQMLFTPSLLAQIFLDNAGADLASSWRHLKSLLLCGEVISQELLAECRARLPEAQVLSEYSISECGTVTLGDVRDTPSHAPFSHAGTADPNVCIYILDDDLAPVPIGCIGELYVGTPSLSLGYSVEELTRERFVPDPFSDHGGGGEPPRMFRTGDAGRFVETAGGELAVELHGRVAFMIKLRGYSIVPGNVESAILSHAAVDACCVKGNTDKGNTDFLVAYCVPTKGSEMPKDAEMKDFLKGLLPYYSIPSVFVALDEMPISETSGKLDRKRLPKAEAPGAVAAAGQTASGGAPNGAPRATYRVTQMERKVVAAWCDVIPSLAAATAAARPGPLESVVEPSASFFDVGGNSLLVTRCIKALLAETGVAVAVHEIFDNITVELLAAFVSKRVKAMHPAASAPAPEDNMLAAVFETFPNLEAGAARERKQDVALLTCAFELPGASSETQFFENLVTGKECIATLSRDELIQAGVPASMADHPDYVPACGMLQRSVYGFDRTYFSISRREACIMDPQQRLFLESCRECLELSGYANEDCVPRMDGALPGDMDDPAFLQTIGCYGGVFTPLYAKRMVSSADDPSHELLVETGCDKDYVSMRAGFLLNLKGQCMTIQTSCSTSLANVASACSATLSGAHPMAIAGAASLIFPQHHGYVYMDGMPVSKDGRCRPFDIDANGTVFSDGVGTVFLKDAEFAKRDRDVVRAVVRGHAVNNDGALKSNFTAPSSQGQRFVVAKALHTAKLRPQSIHYIEAHGTATKLGDPIEVAALIDVFGGARSIDEPWCAIGSAKGGIGHANIASGMAGLIKLMLMVENRTNVPVVNFRSPNPLIPFQGSPFKVPHGAPQEASRGGGADFTFKTAGAELVAGITNLGVGGTNVHMIVSEAPMDDSELGGNLGMRKAKDVPLETRRENQPLFVSAASATSCKALCAKLANLLESDARFAGGTAAAAAAYDDAAFTLRVGRRELSHRVCVLASSAADAAKQLRNSAPGSAATKPAGVVFLLPGQGSQYVNMGRDLYEQEPPTQFRHWMDKCFSLFEAELGPGLKGLVYPTTDAERECAADKLSETINSQPALFSVEYAMAKHLESFGVRADAYAGHSIGEVVAAALSGVFPSFEAAVKIVAARARAMQTAPSGAMLSVGTGARELKELLQSNGLETSCHVACANSPSSCIACGPVDAVDEVEKILPASVARRRLHVKRAFHSPTLSGAANELTKVVSSYAGQLSEPSCPMVSNVTGSMMTTDDCLNPAYWGRHITGTVRFEENVDILLQEGYDTFVEVGPMNTLTRLLKENVSSSIRPLAPQCVSTMRHPKDTSASDVDTLTNAMCSFWRIGGKLSLPAPAWTGLAAFPDRKPRRVSLCAPVPDREEFEQDEVAPHGLHADSAGHDGKLGDVARWINVPCTSQRPPAPVPTSAAAGSLGRMLVIGDCDCGPLMRAFAADGWDVKLCEVLADEGLAHAPHGLAVRSPEMHLGADLRAVLAAMRDEGGLPAKVVVLSTDGDASITDQPGAYDYSGWVLLRNLFVELAQYPDDEVVVHVVAAGLIPVSDGDVVRPAASLLMGPAIVAPQEFANLTIQLIDVPMNSFRIHGASRAVRAVVAECRNAKPEVADKVIALRRQRTWRLSYEPAFAADAAPLHAETALTRGLDALSAGGGYLLTGGLGRIGLKLAQSIATAVARADHGRDAALFLQTRSSFPDRSRWAAEAASKDSAKGALCRTLIDAEAAGKGRVRVHVLRADLTRRSDVDQMFEAVAAALDGEPLTGVLHLAGDMDLRYLTDCTSESLRRLAGPKVPSLHHLVEGIRARRTKASFSSVDFMATFSSMAGVLGGYQMGAYCSVNAYMDAYSHAAAFGDDDKSFARRWVSVCWDDWKQEYAENEQNAAYVLNNHDQYAIEQEEGFRALAYALGMDGEPQVLVSTRPVQARMERWWYHRSSSSSAGSEEEHVEEDEAGEALPAGVLGVCCAAYGTVLGLGRGSAVAPTDNFYALGGDSLLTAKVLGTLRKLLPPHYASQVKLEHVITNATPLSLAACIETAAGEEGGNGGSDGALVRDPSRGQIYDSAASFGESTRRTEKRLSGIASEGTSSTRTFSESDDSIEGQRNDPRTARLITSRATGQAGP